MKITILAVGKIKEEFYQKAIHEFKKRLSRYCRLEIMEVPDEKAPEHASDAQKEIIKEKEGKRLLKQIGKEDVVCSLAIEGSNPDSLSLARKIEDLRIAGKGNITFIIGGSLGLWDEIIKKSDYRLSFSNMTFPHQLMRVILLEQIYRSFKIIQKEPYHK